MPLKIWNKNFILLTASNFLMCLTYYSLIAALPVYIADNLGADKSMIGLVLAAYTIASVLIRPFSGFALDKYGRKIVFLISLVLYSIFFGGYFIAVTIVLMTILRFVHGLSWGVTTISASTLAVDIIPINKRGEGMGYFGVSTTLGIAVGPLLGLLFWHRWGYNGLFISTMISSFAALLCAWFIRYPKMRFRKEKIHFSWRNLFEKHAVLPSVNLMIIMSTYGGLLSFIAIYAHEIGIKNSSGFFLLFALGIGISRFTSGKVFDKKGPCRILTICLSLLIIGYPLLAFVQNIFGFYSAALVLGFGIGVVFPIFQTMVNNLAVPERRGAANSTLYTFLDIGMSIGMMLMGFISHHTSISFGLLVWTAVCTAGLIYFIFFTLPHYEKYKL